LNILQKIKKQLSHCRRSDERFKLELFLKAQEKSGVLQACRDTGKAPRYYYYWWNRYRDSGFQIQALEKKSRRPKSHPRKTSKEVLHWVHHYAAKAGESPENIRRRLEREQQIRISKSTIYRVLRRSDKKPSDEKMARVTLAVNKPPQTPSAPLPRLGERYVLLKELGRGGAGLVYLAQDLHDERRVALKTLSLETEVPATLVHSLQNEFRTLASLGHAHLAKVFDFGQDGNTLYFSSEYVAGRDFLDHCRGANLNSIFQLLVQVLRALDFLHRHGVL